MKKQSFFGGVFVLLFCGILAKILGAIYKIPLTLILGAEGLGIYQLVFPLFAFVLTISSSAMPTAISHLIAKRRSNEVEAVQILKLSLGFLFVVGGIFSILIFFFSNQIADFQGNIMASRAFKAIAPAVLFSSLISCFRGYFQGKLNMVPSGLSHLFEQLFKLLFGLLLGYVFLNFGFEWGPVGALLGICLSEVFVLIFLFFLFLKQKPKKDDQKKTEKNKVLFKKLLKSFFVLGLSNIVLPLSIFVESMIVLGLLQKSGLSLETSTTLWGIESGIVSSITNLPVLLGLSVGAFLVPSLAKDKKNRQENIFKSVFLSMLFAFPLFVLIFFEAGDMIKFLFNSNFSDFQLMMSSSLLKFGAGTTLLFAFLQTENSILQGLGKFFVPAISMGIAFVLKILCFVIFVSSPFGIFGVEISKYVFFGVATFLNFIYLKRKSIKLFSVKQFAPIFLSSAVMGLCLVVLNNFGDFFGVFWTFVFKIFLAFFVFLVAFLCVSSQNLLKKSLNFFRDFLKKRSKSSKN